MWIRELNNKDNYFQCVIKIVQAGLIVENIFSLPGMGGFFVNSVLNRDVFLCCGTVVVYCALLVGMNLIVDIAYTWLDPRIKIS